MIQAEPLEISSFAPLLTALLMATIAWLVFVANRKRDIPWKDNPARYGWYLMFAAAALTGAGFINLMILTSLR